MAKSSKPASEKRSKSVSKKIAEDAETGARRAVLEDLFYDFHSSRAQVFKMNFLRGLFFGFGSAIGATLLIALTIWLLSQFSYVFPPLADFINQLVETMQSRR